MSSKNNFAGDPTFFRKTQLIFVEQYNSARSSARVCVVWGKMAKRQYESLLLFSLGAYGDQSGGGGGGGEDKEVCLLAWQVLDIANMQVGH